MSKGDMLSVIFGSFLLSPPKRVPARGSFGPNGGNAVHFFLSGFLVGFHPFRVEFAHTATNFFTIFGVWIFEFFWSLLVDQFGSRGASCGFFLLSEIFR